MTTTVELSDQELEDLKQLTQQPDASTAVRTAVTEYVRYIKRMKLKELSGRVEMQDHWRELEQAELDEANDQPSTNPD
ncbi:MAG: hypothetical protein ACREIV_02545 [Planctomycetaceae bacterium]